MAAQILVRALSVPHVLDFPGSEYWGPDSRILWAVLKLPFSHFKICSQMDVFGPGRVQGQILGFWRPPETTIFEFSYRLGWGVQVAAQILVRTLCVPQVFDTPGSEEDQLA